MQTDRYRLTVNYSDRNNENWSLQRVTKAQTQNVTKIIIKSLYNNNSCYILYKNVVHLRLHVYEYTNWFPCRCGTSNATYDFNNVLSNIRHRCTTLFDPRPPYTYIYATECTLWTYACISHQEENIVRTAQKCFRLTFSEWIFLLSPKQYNNATIHVGTQIIPCGSYALRMRQPHVKNICNIFWFSILSFSEINAKNNVSDWRVQHAPNTRCTLCTRFAISTG
jgi:hypothetical protein